MRKAWFISWLIVYFTLITVMSIQPYTSTAQSVHSFLLSAYATVQNRKVFLNIVTRRLALMKKYTLYASLEDLVESSNMRIMFFFCKWRLEHVCPVSELTVHLPCSVEDHLEQIAQCYVRQGFEYLNGWRFHNL